jgi:hypothetical protein
MGFVSIANSAFSTIAAFSSQPGIRQRKAHLSGQGHSLKSQNFHVTFVILSSSLGCEITEMRDALGLMNTALVDHYRCPDGFAEVKLKGPAV